MNPTALTMSPLVTSVPGAAHPYDSEGSVRFEATPATDVDAEPGVRITIESLGSTAWVELNADDAWYFAAAIRSMLDRKERQP